MRRSSSVVAWGLLLTACRFDPGGLATGDDVVDPDAEVPVPDATPDMDLPPDMMPDDDADDDGVLDATDNCPALANADQHDEDADGDGDVCDNCPHVANPAQEDTTEETADGVGDACDPDPTGPNHIARFDGFAGDALPAGWTALTPGEWTVAGDALVQPATVVANRIIHLTGAGAAWTDHVVDTAIEVDEFGVGGGSALRSVSMIGRYATGAMNGTGYLCSVFDAIDDDNPAGQIVTRFNDDGGLTGGDNDGLAEELEVGDVVRLRVGSAGTTHSCTSATPASVVSSFVDATHASGGVALRTNGTAASFHYVVVIAAGEAP